jgi:hypothetical protein
MIEFESFVYLDVPKTGSSFIISVLKKFCIEKKVRKILHAGVADDWNPAKLYFISVRDPLDQYVSLYSFGCQAEGKVFMRLSKRGFGQLYDGTWRGFSSWLNFILSPENARFLSEDYGVSEANTISTLVGFQSYRVLGLAMHHATDTLASCTTPDDVRTAYSSNNIGGYTIRTEMLRRDLSELLGTGLKNSISDLDMALQYIEDEQPRNASNRVDRHRKNRKLEKGLARLLREREWPLHELFGY